MIVIHAGNSVAEYAARYDEVAVQRPRQCPLCGAEKCMIAHDWYVRRKPLLATHDPPVPLRIRRWLCKVCGRTTALLPDVLHRHRHYVMAVIAPALLWRYVYGWTWVDIQARLCGGLDPAMPSLAMPSLDSLIRWGKAFERQFVVWLNGLIAVLAVVIPQYVQVNEPATFAQVFAQVFARMALLARWLTHTAVPTAVSTAIRPDQTASLDDISDISRVWGYGWNAGWGRLI